MLVLWLDYGQQRHKVSSLAGAGEEAVRACPGHSEASEHCCYSSFTLDTSGFPRLYGSHETVGSVGSDRSGYVVDWREVHYLVIPCLSSGDEPTSGYCLGTIS